MEALRGNFGSGDRRRQCVRRRLRRCHRGVFSGDSAHTEPRNVGFARAVNQALSCATSPVILLLNPDAVVEEGTVSKLVEVLQNRPEIGAVGPWIVSPDGTPQHHCAGSELSLLGQLLWHFRLAADKPRLAEEIGPHGTRRTERLSGAALAVRREVIDRVGPLDERFFLFFEDADWVLRIRRSGFLVGCVTAARVTHVMGASSGASPLMRSVHGIESELAYFRKHQGRLSDAPAEGGNPFFERPPGGEPRRDASAPPERALPSPRRPPRHEGLSPPMRILVSFPGEHLTGASRYAAGICRELSTRGHEVLTAVHGDGPAKALFASFGRRSAAGGYAAPRPRNPCGAETRFRRRTWLARARAHRSASSSRTSSSLIACTTSGARSRRSGRKLPWSLSCTSFPLRFPGRSTAAGLPSWDAGRSGSS